MTFPVPGEELVLPRRRLVHKPVEIRNLSKKAQASLDVHDFDQWYWELKYDGCHMILIKDGVGNVGAWSREGKPVLSCQHILDEFAHLYPAGTVLFGEAWTATLPFNEISGAFRRHTTQPVLHFMLFDRVRLAEFLAGSSASSAEYRLVGTPTGAHIHHASRIDNPDQLAALEASVQRRRASGRVFGLDGYIAKRRDAPWIAGDGKGGEQIKVKNHISLDLRVKRLVEGEGKFANMLGAFVLEDKAGREYTVSGGTLATDERQQIWFHCATATVGRVCEVHALGHTVNGELREPRFHRWRDDKTDID